MDWIGAMMNRLEKLKDLEKELEKLMKKANSRSFASLARQYRETLYEIEEIEGRYDGDDEIGEILQNREVDRQSDPDRQDNTKFS